jgi:Family of unknown function (DUF5340)
VSKIQLPSLIHYELVLQILEKQTLPDSDGQDLYIRQQAQQLVITMRKAISQQRKLEEDCLRRQLEIEHQWGLNSPTGTPIEVEELNNL